MYVNRWAMKCQVCDHGWHTVLEADVDPDFTCERCPQCGEVEDLHQEFVARV
jgi:hypothetical protein